MPTFAYKKIKRCYFSRSFLSRTAVEPITSHVGQQKPDSGVMDFQFYSGGKPSWCSRCSVYRYLKHFLEKL